jgi:hypothetical protein
MRATVTALAALSLLALDQPGFAQGTSPSVTPKQQAPVARKQSRPPDVNPMPPPRPTPPAAQTDDEADARLNRALNSICRGC